MLLDHGLRSCGGCGRCRSRSSVGSSGVGHACLPPEGWLQSVRARGARSCFSCQLAPAPAVRVSQEQPEALLGLVSAQVRCLPVPRGWALLQHQRVGSGRPLVLSAVCPHSSLVGSIPQWQVPYCRSPGWWRVAGSQQAGLALDHVLLRLFLLCSLLLALGWPKECLHVPP